MFEKYYLPLQLHIIIQNCYHQKMMPFKKKLLSLKMISHTKNTIKNDATSNSVNQSSSNKTTPSVMKKWPYMRSGLCSRLSTEGGFMQSFIFVAVSGLSECVHVFYRLFINALPWKINKRGELGSH